MVPDISLDLLRKALLPHSVEMSSSNCLGNKGGEGLEDDMLNEEEVEEATMEIHEIEGEPEDSKKVKRCTACRRMVFAHKGMVGKKCNLERIEDNVELEKDDKTKNEIRVKKRAIIKKLKEKEDEERKLAEEKEKAIEKLKDIKAKNKELKEANDADERKLKMRKETDELEKEIQMEEEKQKKIMEKKDKDEKKDKHKDEEYRSRDKREKKGNGDQSRRESSRRKDGRSRESSRRLDSRPRIESSRRQDCRPRESSRRLDVSRRRNRSRKGSDDSRNSSRRLDNRSERGNQRRSISRRSGRDHSRRRENRGRRSPSRTKECSRIFQDETRGMDKLQETFANSVVEAISKINEHGDRGKEPPPTWEKTISFAGWRRSVEIWAESNLKPSKKANMLLELLKKDTDHCGLKEMVIQEIIENEEFDYKNEEVISEILDKIESFVEESKWTKNVKLAKELMEFKQNSDEDLIKYIMRFTAMEAKLKMRKSR